VVVIPLRDATRCMRTKGPCAAGARQLHPLGSESLYGTWARCTRQQFTSTGARSEPGVIVVEVIVGQRVRAVPVELDLDPFRSVGGPGDEVGGSGRSDE